MLRKAGQETYAQSASSSRLRIVRVDVHERQMPGWQPVGDLHSRQQRPGGVDHHAVAITFTWGAKGHSSIRGCRDMTCRYPENSPD